MARKKIKTFEASLKRYDVSYGCSLPDFLAVIEGIVAKIPEAERENVTVDWTDGNECDSGYIEFEHYRDETDAEMAQREAGERLWEEQRRSLAEAHERSIFAALKQKYADR